MGGRVLWDHWQHSAHSTAEHGGRMKGAVAQLLASPLHPHPMLPLQELRYSLQCSTLPDDTRQLLAAVVRPSVLRQRGTASTLLPAGAGLRSGEQLGWAWNGVTQKTVFCPLVAALLA